MASKKIINWQTPVKVGEAGDNIEGGMGCVNDSFMFKNVCRGILHNNSTNISSEEKTTAKQRGAG